VRAASPPRIVGLSTLASVAGFDSGEILDPFLSFTVRAFLLIAVPTSPIRSRPRAFREHNASTRHSPKPFKGPVVLHHCKLSRGASSLDYDATDLPSFPHSFSTRSARLWVKFLPRFCRLLGQIPLSVGTTPVSPLLTF